MTGYKDPPKEYQFKPGQSGNPAGRKKGTKLFKTVFKEILQQEVSFNDLVSKECKGDVQQAMAMRLAKMALFGSTDDTSTMAALKTFIEYIDGKAVSKVDGEIKIDAVTQMLQDIGAVNQN